MKNHFIYDESEITATLVDGYYIWIAFKGVSGVCKLKKCDVFDPEKSTRAALAYILEYSKQFHSLDFGILSFNMNPSNLEKIMEENPDAKYWQIPKEKLGKARPLEASNYVSKIYSLSHLLEKNYFESDNSKN